jgi:hypothetical protein
VEDAKGPDPRDLGSGRSQRQVVRSSRIAGSTPPPSDAVERK